MSLILGIESSCDDTAIAVVENGRRVLSSKIASSLSMHERFGGIIPEIAARMHLESIHGLYLNVMKSAQATLKDIDAIAVTVTPGLIGSLLVGHSFAQGLSMASSIPLIPINHVHAHIFSAFLDVEKIPEFPLLAVVVSGGHTQMYYMKSELEFELLGKSLDDACGECFDKVGKILGLSYPGGPKIEMLAREGDSKKFPMPKMMPQKSNPNFSFSGLKTHMLYYVKKNKLNEQQVKDLCASFQEEALGQIIRKIEQALIKNYETHPKCVIVAGGVSANQSFKQEMNKINLPYYFPKLQYCMDNGAMIAAMAHHLLKDLNS